MSESQPTHQEIIAAYDALDTLCDRVPATRAVKESILRVLPPKPRSTMAEIEWDQRLLHKQKNSSVTNIEKW